MNKLLGLTAAIALAGASFTASAADGDAATGAFLRAEAGSSRLEVSGDSGNDTAFSVRGGYFFNKNVAIEGFYTNYGEDSDSTGSASIDGFGIGVVGKKHLDDSDVGLYFGGRIGVAFNSAELKVSGVGNFDGDKTAAYYGVGMGYDFSRNFGVSLNVDRTKADFEALGVNVGATVTTATLGLEYRF